MIARWCLIADWQGDVEKIDDDQFGLVSEPSRVLSIANFAAGRSEPLTQWPEELSYVLNEQLRLFKRCEVTTASLDVGPQRDVV